MLTLATPSVSPPDADATWRALRLLSRVLDTTICWHYQGAYHFKLEDGWTLALSPQSAGRFRLEACKWTRPVSTLYAFEGDDDRLASAALDLEDMVTRSETYRA